jgi:PAS domain-containing protein
MRSETNAERTTPHTRGVIRDDRQVVALIASALLLAVAATAALWTEAVPDHREVALLSAGVSAILLVGVFVWAGVGPRRALIRDLLDADARYRAMVEELPAVLYVADFGADATWHYVSPRIRELLGYSAEPELVHRDNLVLV